MRTRWVLGTLVALMTAVISGTTVHALMNLDGDGDGTDAKPSRPAAPSPSAPTGSAAPTTSSTPSATPEGMPEVYLGTWNAVATGGGTAPSRTLDLREGGIGDRVMVLAGVTGTYTCTWEAGLEAVGKHVVLSRSRVTYSVPKGACKPGGETRTDADGGQGGGPLRASPPR